MRTIKAKLAELLAADLAGMLPLPPDPLHLGWRNRIRLGRDYYVRLDTCDYSVDPNVIGRLVDVSATSTGSGSAPRAGWWPTTPGSGHEG